MDNLIVKRKYCTNDKVQVMFSNAPRQIICSKDGYLYLRDGNVTVHKYLSDPIRNQMPHHLNPSSKSHATHLFKYNQVYAKFTRYRNMAYSFLHDEDSYTLSFLYFQKFGLRRNEAINTELYLSDFTPEDWTVSSFTRSELEDFLYGTFNIRGKYIFHYSLGILFAQSIDEDIVINNFLDLTDATIINLYNYAQKCKHFSPLPPESMNLFIHFDGKPVQEDLHSFEQESVQKGNESWKAYTIDEVEEFSLTNYGLNGTYPIMLVITDTEVIVYKFEVIYCGKDSYKVRSQKTNITPNVKDILTAASTAKYEPSYK